MRGGLVRKSFRRLILKGRFAEGLHHRDDAGRFVSKVKLQAAKSDPAAATALLARVTKPAERAKLQRILGGDADPGRTKRGPAWHEADARRMTKEQSAKRAAELTSLAMRREAHADHIAEHLPNLTKDRLRARFGGGHSPRPVQMVMALVAHAERKARDLGAVNLPAAAPKATTSEPESTTEPETLTSADVYRTVRHVAVEFLGGRRRRFDAGIRPRPRPEGFGRRCGRELSAFHLGRECRNWNGVRET